jgi:hypothetical protein
MMYMPYVCLSTTYTVYVYVLVDTAYSKTRLIMPMLPAAHRVKFEMRAYNLLAAGLVASTRTRIEFRALKT